MAVCVDFVLINQPAVIPNCLRMLKELFTEALANTTISPIFILLLESWFLALKIFITIFCNNCLQVYSKYHLTAKERKVNAESSRKSPHLKGHVFLKI